MLKIGPAIDFHDKTNAYGALGLFVAETSALEFALDDFIFKFHEKHRRGAIAFSKKAPRKLGEKLDFYLKCLINTPSLRTFPFWDFELDANATCYRVEEIFDVRNHLAHGAIDLTEHDEGRTIYTASKYTRNQNGSFSIARYSIGSGFLDALWRDCKSTRRYFERLAIVLSQPNYWEDNYQDQKEIIKNRSEYRELAFLLGIHPAIDEDFFENDEITITLGGVKLEASGVES